MATKWPDVEQFDFAADTLPSWKFGFIHRLAQFRDR
jgi:hypothetical protein